MLVAPRSRSRSCVRYGWGVGEAGVVIQAYRFALDPTPGQDAVLRSHCGGQRYALYWGWGCDGGNGPAERGSVLRHPRRPMDAVAVVVGLQLAETVEPGQDTVAPWWAENSKE